jgi:hypothetical protein
VYALDKADDVALDSNHTHFILADNGCIKPDSFGADIKLRASLEQYIRNSQIRTKKIRNTSINGSRYLTTIERIIFYSLMLYILPYDTGVLT